MTIFGVPWESLELEDVERFLAAAGPEPLTWEAKGTELRAEQVTKHVGGFANAAEGGYLLLGFEVIDGEWRARGFAFPGEDPPVWASNVVRTTLRPRPRIDVRSWAVGEGRHAAVVQIDPVAEPPCVTAGGQLYERVSGETIRVRDPADVRALYERGTAALARAEAAALRALEAVVVESVEGDVGAYLVLPLVIAPVGTAADISAQVFAEGIAERLSDALDELPREPLFPERGWRGGPREVSVRTTQESVIAETDRELVHFWRLRLAWDGSAAGLLRLGVAAEEGAQSLIAQTVLERGLQPLAAAVERAARGIGGYGRAHVTFRPFARQFSLRHGDWWQDIPDPEALRPIQRWAEGDPWFSEELLDGAFRELLRAAGIQEWEPAAGGQG